MRSYGNHKFPCADYTNNSGSFWRFFILTVLQDTLIPVPPAAKGLSHAQDDEAALSISIEKSSIGLISISPNPADNKLFLNLELDEKLMTQITARDLLGNALYSNKAVLQGEKTLAINISPFPSGVYILSVQNKLGSHSAQFIKH